MKIKNKSAIALILSVGILAILALITVGFSAFTRLELQATENQINLLKASFIAQAGIAKAIEDIKYDPTYGALNDPYDTAFDPWYYQGNGSFDGPSVDLATADNPSYGDDVDYAGGYYRLKVIDCGGLININCPLPNTDAENDLANILDQLGLVDKGAALVAYRQTLFGGVFTTKDEIKLVPGIGKAKYEAIKDFITLWGDEDDGIISLDKSLESPVSGHTRKSFVNVNTAPREVLIAVFSLMMSDSDEAILLADAVKARRSINPFDGADPDADVNNFLSARGEFERFLEYAEALNIITGSNCAAVMAQSDPNTYSTNSTKIGFDANGYYEIEAIGTYRGAKKKIKQALAVFRKINQTSQYEFSSNSGSVTCRVNWKNSCPVDFTLLKAYSYADDPPYDPDSTDYIYNSVKLGFWDNFSEGYDPDTPNPDSEGKLGPWQSLHETFTINQSGDGKLRTWVDGPISIGLDYFPQIALDENVCTVDDFAIIVHSQDEDNLNNIKYPGFRDNLPWPAVPAQWAWIWAPAPDATNCPDIADGKITAAEIMAHPYFSYRIHEQYLNSFHTRFGGIFWTGEELMSAIYCNGKQEFDQLTHSIPVYRNWVQYDAWSGNLYIYFTPSPTLTTPGWTSIVYQTCTKPYSVISGANVMVSCNEWIWSGHPSDYGTEYFPLPDPAYRDERTFHLKAVGRWHTRGEVYFSGISPVSFITTEQIMVYEDRYFKFAGMGNLPDMDYVRIVPRQGVYTSNMFDPTTGMGSGQFLEWGTISAHVTLPDAADSVREAVYLTVADSAIVTVPDPADVPSPAILASGGAIGTTASQSICYQAYLFSDKDVTVIADTDFEQAPVLEDITITYLPKTKIVYQNTM
ncbi:MAG: hypothetical protein V1747_01040 [Candidatus Omnitrophota bacterium]